MIRTLRDRRGAWALAAIVLAIPGAMEAQTALSVEGRVEDVVTGRPLAAVMVRAPGVGVGVETGRDGRFVLGGLADTALVVIERLGYAPVRYAAARVPSVVGLEAAPVLLDALSASASPGSGLARGTALSVATVGGSAVHGTAATSVAEGLAGAEGVSVARMGAWGARPVLRGLSGERVAVLVDGNRVARACAFGMDQGLSTVDPASVERVEILTGPGSTLYGSGNIGGVINVVTRRPAVGVRPVSGEVRMKASSAVPGGTLGGTIWLATGAASVSGSLEATRHDDYRSPTGVVEGSGLRQTTGTVRAELAPKPDRRVSLQAQAYEGRDIGWPAMPGGVIPRQSRRSASLDYSRQLAGAVVDGVSGRVYVQRLDHEMRVPMTMGEGAMAMTQTTTQISHAVTSGGRVQLRVLPLALPGVHVDLGVEATHRAAEATRSTHREGGTMPPSTLTLHTWPAVRILDAGAFGQGEARVSERVTVVAGVRADHVSRRADGWEATSDGVLTGNVGGRLELGRGLTARTSVGAGYRTPDPTELFGLALRPDGFVYRGNPELGTERNRNLEVGLALETPGLAASVTGFRNEMRDLIAPVVVADETVEGRPVRSYANVAEARLAGASGTVRWSAAPWLDVGGTASYTRGENLESGLPLAAVPPLEGSVSLRVRPVQAAGGSGRSWVEAVVSAASRQDRIAEQAGEIESPGYQLLDVRSGFSVGRATFLAGVENVFDRAYRGHLDPRRLLRPGRGVYLNVAVPVGGAP
jgi:outer membrane receptor protein involved in Fe transport